MKNSKMKDAVVIGAGVAGIYQIKQLVDNGFEAVLLEANDDLGGTWFKNRYPGCRFDSESYSYGFAFSRELVNEWHWKERFSAQPENLKYLNFVVDKFDLRRHMRFNSAVESMKWSESDHSWTLTLGSGETFVSRFVVTCMGVLSVPYTPSIDGMETFQGQSFHSFDWPNEPLDLSGKRVGVIGTGATGIQIIAEIADKVGELAVFQRRPNWSIPLNNSPISEQEMADIRARYDEILETCEQSQGGFVHLPDRRGYDSVTDEEKRALWDELYDRPGFALLLANFPETFLQPEANRDLSRYVAERTRQRVNDPELAEKLIPTDHGFGMKRLPLETNYFEAYNRDNVSLVDILDSPIKQVTATGIQTTAAHYDLDVIVYATGFNAITGALSRIDIEGVGGLVLRDKWCSDTSTYLGLLSHGFPNMLMVAGPQSVSGSTNYPRAIETGVNWVTRFLLHTRESQVTRFEVQESAEQSWVSEVAAAQERMPFSRVKSWFTGYAPNSQGGENGSVRYNAFWGGGPRYKAFLQQAEADGYSTIDMAYSPASERNAMKRSSVLAL